jgi:hypothetical protein
LSLCKHCKQRTARYLFAFGTHPPQRAEATSDTVEQNMQSWPATRLTRAAALLFICRLINLYRYRGATLCMEVSYTINSCNIFSRAGRPIDA